MEDLQGKNIWNKECEELLAEWSEKASCYRWLHGRCEKNYRKWYYSFSIPVIVLSTLTGAANVGMDSFVPAESKSIASAIVGGVNIFAGIISTLQNFLKVAEYMEGHRIAGVSWGKLQRNIAIELALDPCRRVLQGDFLKLARAEYDRLIEAGPIISDSVIMEFNKKFKNYEVSVPSICNGLDKCNIYKKNPNIEMNIDEFTEGIEDIISIEEKEDIKPLKIIKTVKDDTLMETEIKINEEEDHQIDNEEKDKVDEKLLSKYNDNCKCEDKKQEEDKKEEEDKKKEEDKKEEEDKKQEEEEDKEEITKFLNDIQ